MRTGRPKQPLPLSVDEQERLQSLAHRARSQPALARRARVVLACSEGLENRAVAKKLRCSLGMVGKWRSRFLKTRLEGLYDEPRPGAPRKVMTTMLSRSSFRHWKLRRVDRHTGARADWLKRPGSVA